MSIAEKGPALVISVHNEIRAEAVSHLPLST